MHPEVPGSAPKRSKHIPVDCDPRPGHCGGMCRWLLDTSGSRNSSPPRKRIYPPLRLLAF
eukprot:1724903-Pyramimonas_sp.AAC.1